MLILEQYSQAIQSFIENEIYSVLKKKSRSDIVEPMMYSLLAGGKRIRPFLLLMTAGVKLDGITSAYQNRYRKSSMFAACSLEMIHTYSLIHDDLPSMDNDDLRRGRPSCHVKFNEWKAILAGDAMNTFAFEMLLRSVFDGRHDVLFKLIQILSDAAGAGGMICGQFLDLSAEKENDSLSHYSGTKENLLKQIHLSKTAAMIRASCEMGAVISGAKDVEAYRSYGENLGLLFQIADDILDVTGDSSKLGKTAGKDIAAGKLTYPSLYGLDESRNIARSLADELMEKAAHLVPGEHAENDFCGVLAELPGLIYSRNH